MMGLEEHLLGMFREDFEFNDTAPSHLGGAKLQSKNTTNDEMQDPAPTLQNSDPSSSETQSPQTLSGEKKVNDMIQFWTQEAELELKKIPFFVRGKAKRNTEKFAKETGVVEITVETLYDAKAHFSR